MPNRFPYARDPSEPLNMARDWPLWAAAVSAVLSFVMLFPPWLTSPGVSLNAFGHDMLTAGPALVVVMVVIMLILVYGALATRRTAYVAALLVPASNLLTLYIVQVADVSDLADLSAGSGVPGAATGAGVWLGFVFAVVAALCTAVAFVRWRGTAARPAAPADAVPPDAPEPPERPGPGPSGGPQVPPGAPHD
ncbi:hypothetical protein BLA24_24010 [Streptomyces cinnamoneus]|uniref:Uncharacterized protein n=1 Tax=Streptomyces cinnamoneus TaxID=53446 RepID=A0A2G1XD94_STRCJ|nr:hypothetical protein [Streptomyces cinnamoneus]PHQ49139.1 hypothetical protein BLA24_24010 [Streptomyces cinnamoneus]PPT15211.1 hypothetical protein CYQ11_22060 [Streptomyces cinnamoneus]